MIRRHAFNSTWWGGDVGIVVDDALFELDPKERERTLAAWQWVERRDNLDPSMTLRLAPMGFLQMDTQLGFRIGLTKLEGTPSVDRLDVEYADESAFHLNAEQLPDFRHERFLMLPGATPERVNRRYALWAEELIAKHPETCLRISDAGEVQGWFLSRRLERGLELTLAMLHRDAHISGHGLYLRALLAYRARGFRVGSASFSVSNTAVHGIYGALGARFLPPQGCWLWTPEWGRSASSHS